MSTSDRYTVTHYAAPMDCVCVYAAQTVTWTGAPEAANIPSFAACAPSPSDNEIVADVCRRLLEGSIGDGLREMLRMALDRAEAEND